MNIWEKDTLFLFIAFVIPGFISLKVYELFFPSPKPDSTKQLIDALTYSCINYSLLFIPIFYIEKSELQETFPFLYLAFYAFVLLGAPILWAWSWKGLRTKNFFQKFTHHPIQKPWDFVFGQKIPYWVIVTLKDGTKIGGSYDDKSFASSNPAEEQLYLEEHWEINSDGGFERARESTEGILILASEMVSVELFSRYEEGR